MSKIILIICSLELIFYALPFVRIKSESDFLNSTKASNISTTVGIDRFISLPGALLSPHINGGTVSNTENINGYNPIFPKRLLWIVNAAEGRDSNHMESVSLNITKDNRIYEVAGINAIYKGESAEKIDNHISVYWGVKIISDDSLKQLIYDDEVFPGSSTDILVSSSDEKYTSSLPSEASIDCNPDLKVSINSDFTYNISSSSDCNYFFLFPQLYYPGWSIKFGETTIKPFPAFRFLQGYYIPSGDFDGTIKYIPTLGE